MTDIVERLCPHCGVLEDEHDYEQLARECYPKQIEHLRAENERLKAELRVAYRLPAEIEAAMLRVEHLIEYVPAKDDD